MDSHTTSPVDWYLCSYLLRFVELAAGALNNDLGERFLSWENTVLIKATSLDQAYDKTVAIALGETTPYKGGDEGVDVQWVFEGVTELLPIYEEIADGAEIFWTEHQPRKLKNLRKQVRAKSEFLG